MSIESPSRMTPEQMLSSLWHTHRAFRTLSEECLRYIRWLESKMPSGQTSAYEQFVLENPPRREQ